MTTAVASKTQSALALSARRLFSGLHDHALAQLIEGIERGTILPPPMLYETSGISTPAARLAWTQGFIGLPPGGAELLAKAMNREVHSASWMAMLMAWNLR